MPLIQVDLDRDVFDSPRRRSSSDAIHQAQIDALGIPADDLFQVFRPHGAGELRFDPGYDGVDRRQLVLIRVTMVHMYSVATKRRFFEAVVERLRPRSASGARTS